MTSIVGCGQPMLGGTTVAQPAPAPAVTQSNPNSWANLGANAGPQSQVVPNSQFNPMPNTSITGFQNGSIAPQALNWTGRFQTQVALQTSGGWLVQEATITLQPARDGTTAFTFESIGQIPFVLQGNLSPVQISQQNSGWVYAASQPRPLSIAGRNAIVLLMGVPGGDISRAELSLRDCEAARDCSAELPIMIRPGLSH